SDNALQHAPMVPVGVRGPEGRTSALAYDAATPPHGLASWGSLDDRISIPPGRSQGDFRLVSYGLPAIRDVRAEPDVTPPPDLADWAALDAFYQQFVFRGRTVGPKAPPQTFVALEFLNYLISLLHDGRQISWIREAEEEKELLKNSA
ncbi:MAG: hypothetical protein DMD82_13355, partial [Candidatus Rokuibacteriota bacterium]